MGNEANTMVAVEVTSAVSVDEKSQAELNGHVIIENQPGMLNSEIDRDYGLFLIRYVERGVNQQQGKRSLKRDGSKSAYQRVSEKISQRSVVLKTGRIAWVFG